MRTFCKKTFAFVVACVVLASGTVAYAQEIQMIDVPAPGIEIVMIDVPAPGIEPVSPAPAAKFAASTAAASGATSSANNTSGSVSSSKDTVSTVSTGTPAASGTSASGKTNSSASAGATGGSGTSETVQRTGEGRVLIDWDNPEKYYGLPENFVVYLPKTEKASRFHAKADCSGMNSPTKTTIKNVKGTKYTPCKKCFEDKDS